MVHRIGNDLYSENSKFYGDRVCCFPVGGFSVFLILIMWPGFTKTILREAWPLHSRSKV